MITHYQTFEELTDTATAYMASLRYNLKMIDYYQREWRYVGSYMKKKGIKESVNYFNSDDFNYFLKFTRVPDYLSATLFDSKTDLAHHFTVKESKSNGNIFFAFEYVQQHGIEHFTINRAVTVHHIHEFDVKRLVIRERRVFLICVIALKSAGKLVVDILSQKRRHQCFTDTAFSLQDKMH